MNVDGIARNMDFKGSDRRRLYQGLILSRRSEPLGAMRPRQDRRGQLRFSALMSLRYLSLLTGLFVAYAAQAQTNLINGIGVIVNEAVITYRDLEGFASPAIELALKLYRNDQALLRQKVDEARQEAIDNLVARQLILHDFAVSGYVLPETVVENEINRVIRQRFGDRLTLVRTLQAEGLTFESFRQQTRERIIVESLKARNISGEIIISPFKIETWYKQHEKDFQLPDQVKLRMIVLNKTASSGDGPRKLADEIVRKLNEGAPFGEMASIYSEGSQRSEGGLWGWADRTTFKSELANAAFALEPGKPSSVIDLTEACYILLVEEKRAAHIRPLPEVRTEIEKTLVGEEQSRLEKRYIERLKKKSFIRYF
jgi:peptidyl-prolyl cis-trans isomerase SurA